MEKEVIKSRSATEQRLVDAVHQLVEEGGFEGLGINAVAAQAGVSKMLIYRYFGSLDGLIATYIAQHDFWLNFDLELLEQENLGDFVKRMLSRQIQLMRENYVLRRLYRWELTAENAMVKELRCKREEKGLQLVEWLSKASGRSLTEVAFLATLLNSSINYLVLLGENCPVYNGIKIGEDAGWRQIENGISDLIDGWILKK